MLHIALFEPLIPANTGNIIRLCANTNSTLHLIEPLGFYLDNKKLMRAGLDYHELVNVKTHKNFTAMCIDEKFTRILAFSSKATLSNYNIKYHKDDLLLFGNEVKGLPEDILNHKNVTKVKIPMTENSRCLNLANSASIAVYEALRQQGFSF